MWLILVFLYLNGVLLALTQFRGNSVLGESSIEVSRTPTEPILYEQLELPLADSMNAKYCLP